MPRVGKQTSKTKKSFPRNRSDEDFTACVWTVTSLNKCNLNCTQKQMLGVWVRYRFNDFDGKISLNQLFILIFSTLTLKGGFKEASWSLKIYIFLLPGPDQHTQGSWDKTELWAPTGPPRVDTPNYITLWTMNMPQGCGNTSVAILGTHLLENVNNIFFLTRLQYVLQQGIGDSQAGWKLMYKKQNNLVFFMTLPVPVM